MEVWPPCPPKTPTLRPSRWMLRILRSSGGSDKSLNKTIILTVTALGEVDESVSLKVRQGLTLITVDQQLDHVERTGQHHISLRQQRKAGKAMTKVIRTNRWQG